MSNYNAFLLKTAREQAGLSQGDLANKLGIKQALLCKYERCTLVPSSQMQEKMAQILQYPVSFFLQPDEESLSGLVFHRKRSSLPAGIRTKIEAEVHLRSMDIIRLFTVCEKKSNIILREGRGPENMARALRKYWNVPSGGRFLYNLDFSKHMGNY